MAETVEQGWRVDIALAQRRLEKDLAFCDEIVAQVEAIYVTGIPAGQISAREHYDDALEARAEALDLSKRIPSMALAQAWFASRQMSEAIGKAMMKFAIAEHDLFPERRMRELPNPMKLLLEPSAVSAPIPQQRNIGAAPLIVAVIVFVFGGGAWLWGSVISRVGVMNNPDAAIDHYANRTGNVTSLVAGSFDWDNIMNRQISTTQRLRWLTAYAAILAQAQQKAETLNPPPRATRVQQDLQDGISQLLKAASLERQALTSGQQGGPLESQAESTWLAGSELVAKVDNGWVNRADGDSDTDDGF